jgi:hypothetical protein
MYFQGALPTHKAISMLEKVGLKPSSVAKFEVFVKSRK